MASSKLKQVREKLNRFALSLPEATEDFPWGERVVKVNKKVFAFLGRDMDPHFGLGVKLKASHAQALSEPFASPMGYGLGKSGWVSAKFEPDAKPSFEYPSPASRSFCSRAQGLGDRELLCGCAENTRQARDRTGRSAADEVRARHKN